MLRLVNFSFLQSFQAKPVGAIRLGLRTVFPKLNWLELMILTICKLWLSRKVLGPMRLIWQFWLPTKSLRVRQTLNWLISVLRFSIKEAFTLGYLVVSITFRVLCLKMGITESFATLINQLFNRKKQLGLVCL